MSYAGRSSRGTSAAPPSRPSRAASQGGRSTPARGRSRSAAQADADAAGEMDWQQVALFGAGLALGIAVGAGAALLSAPRSGAEARAALARAVGRTARGGALRTRDAWEDLGDELRSVRRMLRQRRARRAAPPMDDEYDETWAAGAGGPRSPR